MNEKHIRILATAATIAAVCMYTSYGFKFKVIWQGGQSDPAIPASPACKPRSDNNEKTVGRDMAH